MPSNAYRLIWRAIRRRRQLVFRYGGSDREACPLILGYSADGREALFAYQFAGATSGQSKLPDWRCFYVADIDGLRSRLGPWHEGTSHKQTQSCVRHIDVDANVADTLKQEKPLPFGSPLLRPPRRG